MRLFHPPDSGLGFERFERFKDSFDFVVGKCSIIGNLSSHWEPAEIRVQFQSFLPASLLQLPKELARTE
jgi:hypothetical protein